MLRLTPVAAPAADARSRAVRRRVLAVLCTTVVTSYGVLFYAFPVLALTITAAVAAVPAVGTVPRGRAR